MVDIPTPIPEYVVDWLGNFLGGPVLLTTYRFALLLVGGLVIYAASQSAGAFTAIIIGIVVSVVLADDIRQLITDIWNMNFWVFEA